MSCKSVYSDAKYNNKLRILGVDGLEKCHLCMVALTTGVVACGLAWGLLQAGPLTGIFSHEFGTEGGTGPIC